MRIELCIVKSAQAVLLSLTDDGPGIVSADGEAIFRPFYTTRADGSGVGLTLARQIARAHGGDLRLKPSKVDEGARFELLLTSG